MHHRVAKCADSAPEFPSTDIRQEQPRLQVYPEHASVAELVAQRAIASPDAVAVVTDREALSYGELEARASQLAHHLRPLGAAPEQLIVLYLERSLALIVAALGVLKTGAAYVPLDPTLPPDRLLFMLKDCGAALVISQQSV